MGMVETTLERLNEGELVEIDEERKAHGFKSPCRSLWQS